MPSASRPDRVCSASKGGVPACGRTCLPVQRGCGLRMAGMGILPSQSSSHISMFIKTSRAMKVSRLVISRQPSSVSCTMPITGLLPCKHSKLENQDAEEDSVALDWVSAISLPKSWACNITLMMLCTTQMILCADCQKHFDKAKGRS